MGWTGCERAKGTSNLDFFSKEFDHEKGKVLDVASKNGAAYIAYQTIDAAGALGPVMGIVCLMHWAPRDLFNFRYKDVSEDMGPTESQCPQRILDRLSPAEQMFSGQCLEWAQAWRARCRANLAEPKVRLTKGTVLIFDPPLSFTNGRQAGRLECTDARRLLFSDGYGRFRLNRRALTQAVVASA